MNWELYAWCVLGIVMSVILPSLSASVRSMFPAQQAGTAGVSDNARALWTVIKPYIVLGLFSALTAIIIIKVFGAQIEDSSAAVLAGYAWDSTLQKLTKR